MSNRTCWRTSNPLPFPKSGGFQTSGRVQPMQGAANADFSVQILRSIVLQREMLSWSILPQCWGHGHVDAVFPCFQECWPWMFDSQVHPVSWSTLAMFLFALTWLKLHCLPSVGGIDASNHGRNGGQNWIPLSLLQNKTGLWVLVHCENHVYTAVITFLLRSHLWIYYKTLSFALRVGWGAAEGFGVSCGCPGGLAVLYFQTSPQASN